MEFPVILVIVLGAILIYNSYVQKKFRELNDNINDLKNQLKNLPRSTPESYINKEEKIPDEAKKHTETQPETVFRIEQPVHFKNQEQPERKPDFIDNILDFLKQNTLTILGILTLVIGIGYFVKYAIDKNWINENLRLAFGIAAGLGITGLGVYLKKNYPVFSAILSGGGIAVLYFTITIAFREYHIFSQNFSFIILFAITVFAVFLALYFKSETLIIFALLGGFGAPLMISTGQSNYPFLFSYISILNLGMLAIVYLKNWRNISWVSFILTNIYLVFWILDKTEKLSLLFAAIFYVVFYAFALRNYFRKKESESLDYFVLILTNIIYVTITLYVSKETGIKPLTLLPLIFVLINGILAFTEFRKKTRIQFSVFTGILISLLSIIAAVEFETHIFTSIWAVESTLLLYSWKKTKQKIFYQGFQVLFLFTFLALCGTWAYYENAEQLRWFLNPLFMTGGIVLASSIINVRLLHDRSSAESSKDLSNIAFTVSYLILFTMIFLEIFFHLQEWDISKLSVIVLLYSIYFIFGLKFFIQKYYKPYGKPEFFTAILLVLFIFISGFSGITSDILGQKISFKFYSFYLLYLIPFFSVFYGISRKLNTDDKLQFRYWFISFVFIFIICKELFHIYIWIHSGNAEFLMERKLFNMLYLPIIWTISGIGFIYLGLKKNIPEFNRIGFALIGIMIIKLYAVDVWQMDHVSRIVAFIVLGILLLSGSFVFQKLKKVLGL